MQKAKRRDERIYDPQDKGKVRKYGDKLRSLNMMSSCPVQDK